MKKIIQLSIVISAFALGSCKDTASEELVYVDKVDSKALDHTIDTIPKTTLGDDDAAGVTIGEGSISN